VTHDRDADPHAGPVAPPRRGSARVVAIGVGGLALLALAVLLRVPQLTEDLWYDETLRTRVWLSGWSAVRQIFGDVHPPLYSASMWVWIRLFGDSELSIRLPGLVLGLGSAGALSVWLGRRFTPAAGWLCAAWLALSPVHVAWSCEAKNNMTLVGLTTLSLLALERLVRRPSPARWLALVVLAIAATYTQYLALLVVLPAVVLAVVSPRSDAVRAGRPAVAAAGAAVLASLVPLAALKMPQLDSLWRAYLDPFTAAQLWDFLAHFLPTGWVLSELHGVSRAFREPSSPAGLAIAGAFGALVLALVALGARRAIRSFAGRLLVVAFAAPIALLMAIAWPLLWINGESVYQARNLLVCLPPFAALLALGVTSLPRPTAGVLAAGVLAAALLGTLTMHSHAGHGLRGLEPNAPWRTIAERARRHAGPDPIVCGRYPAWALLYYLPGAEYEPLGPDFGDDRPEPEVLAEALATGRPVVVFSNARWSPLTEEDLADLGRVAPFRLLFKGRRITLWACTPPPAPGGGPANLTPPPPGGPAP
jgi:mannosyltransferase